MIVDVMGRSGHKKTRSKAGRGVVGIMFSAVWRRRQGMYSQVMHSGFPEYAAKWHLAQGSYFSKPAGTLCWSNSSH
jgi:hypothetical protein